MKLTVNKYLNARTGAASTASPCNFYQSPGNTIAIDDMVVGQELDGNSIWYHCADDGCYYWSGGIEDVQFQLENKKYFESLDESEIMLILGEAKSYFWNIYFLKLETLTGIFIGDKISNQVLTLKNYALVFQVTQKTDAIPGELIIPPTLFFKGLEIKTDVIEAAVSQFQAAKPGDSIARLSTVNTWGTLSLKVSREEEEGLFYYLLTNYHVAAGDLISQGVYSYDLGDEEPANGDILVSPAPATLHNANAIGGLSEGLLSAFHDVALILLNDEKAAGNQVTKQISVKDSLDVWGNNEFKGNAVTLYGAKSGMSTKKIISVNSSQFFEYKKGVLNQLIDLIQVELFSQPGDSGSPVLKGNKIIGILVGADDTNSYVIPITRILKYFNLKIP